MTKALAVKGVAKDVCRIRDFKHELDAVREGKRQSDRDRPAR
jgi:hypothetical protein